MRDHPDVTTNTSLSLANAGIDDKEAIPSPGSRAARRRIGRLPLIALALLPLVGGCAELTEGPTIVPLTDRSFSVRYLPLRDDSASIEHVAEVRCAKFNEAPSLVNTYRFTFFDVRETTFRCVADT